LSDWHRAIHRDTLAVNQITVKLVVKTVSSRSFGHAIAPVVGLSAKLVKQSDHLTNCPNFRGHFCFRLSDLSTHFVYPNV